MKRHTLLFYFIFIFSFAAFSQKGDNGSSFYFGYGMGKYSPGLGNLKSTMYLYDQQYGADFKYRDILHGPAIGFRSFSGLWQMDFEWLFRHSKNESTFTEPLSNEEWKLGIKTRYNTIFWGNAIKLNKFAIGAGLDIGSFKLFTKRTPVGVYKSTKWSKNKGTLYGNKIVFSDLMNITGGVIIYFDYMPGFLGLRAYYAIPIGTEEFADDNTLSFYSFKPSNFGLSLFVLLNTNK
ncbi:MAG: hypothetical protein PHT69_06080 [Bacteroidales bacterium]|nr:hypothetical protein [Bacteroidales bacterium]